MLLSQFSEDKRLNHANTINLFLMLNPCNILLQQDEHNNMLREFFPFHQWTDYAPLNYSEPGEV